MAKTTRDAPDEFVAARPVKKQKKKAISPAHGNSKEAILTLLADLRDQSLETQSSSEAKKARKLIDEVISSVSQQLDEQAPRLAELTALDLDEWTADEDALQAAIAADEEALQALQAELAEQEELVEEDEIDLKDLRKNREKRQAQEAESEVKTVHALPLALYPIDATDPIPTIYDAWEDPFLIDLAQTLQPALEKAVKKIKKSRKNVNK